MTAILRRLCVLFESSHHAKDPLRLPISAVPVMANRRSAKPHMLSFPAGILTFESSWVACDGCGARRCWRPWSGPLIMGRATAAWDWLAARYAGGWRGRPVAGPDRGHTDEYRA